MIVAAGLVAVVTTIRLVNRFAHMTGTKEYIRLYEEMIMLGAIVGNVFYVFDVSLNFGEVAGAVSGLLTGMYTGAFVVAIAETIKGLPVFTRRIRISTGLSYVLVSLALGKAIGGLISSFVF